MALKGSIAPSPDRPAVTVIVPAWNSARTIERAIRSVLDAGLEAVEVVVVDDASTDETVAVVERIAAVDPRVVLLRSETNRGPSVARNRALEAARGTWLTFLDADDRLLPGGLAALVHAATGPGSDGVRAVVGQRVWTDGRMTWRSAAYDIPEIRRPGRASLAERPGLLSYASATGKLFHRSLGDGLAFEGRVLGDQIWPVRALIRAGDGIAVIADDVYEWSRPRRGQPSTSITATKFRSASAAAVAARVAVLALQAARTEAAASVPDPAARARIVSAYFDRLVRLDLAGPIRRAVAGADAGADELFTAVGEFLAAAPGDLVGASPAVARDVIRAPLDRWLGFREPGRSAYWRLLRALLLEHPGLVGRAGGVSLARAALAIVRRSDSPRARRIARALIVLNTPVGLVNRLRRLVRPGWVRLRTIGRPRP